MFSDLTPYHILSMESIEDLNSRMDGIKVTPVHFRCSITVSGCQPYEEDTWRFIRIGDKAVFRYVKDCERYTYTYGDYV